MWGHGPTEWDRLCWPIPMLVHPHAGPLGSESGLCVCVQGCLWCAEGGPFHCCLLVEQPMAGLGVSLRAPWEELCWGSVCLYIRKWVRSPSLCVSECPRTLGSWGLFLCPVWLLTRPVGSRRCECGTAPSPRFSRAPDLVQSVWLLPFPAGNTACLLGTVRAVCAGNCHLSDPGPQVCQPCDPGCTRGLRAREPLPLCVGLSPPSVLDSVTFLYALGACEGWACDLEVC